MEPRLKKSTRWTAFPKDILTQIRQAFADSFKAQSKNGRFLAEGRIYPQEILLQIGYLENGRLKQNNFEISIEYVGGKDDIVKLIYLAVDVAASLMQDLFSAEDDSEFPKIWQEFELEGRKIYLQYSSANSALDAEADRLLGEQTDSLVQGPDPEEDLEPAHIKRILGLDVDDEDPDDGNDDPIKH